MKKYLFGHFKVTNTDVKGKTNTIKNNKTGTNVVIKTKITLIAAIRAIKGMLLIKLSFL